MVFYVTLYRKAQSLKSVIIGEEFKIGFGTRVVKIQDNAGA